MRWLRENWQTIALVALPTAVVGMLLVGPPSACPTPAATKTDSPIYAETKAETKTEPKGEEAMSTDIQAQGKVHYAEAANFDELVLNADGPVLVDFYADWCGPCQMIAPVLEELARENPEVRIVKVDVDQDPELAARYRISSIPSLKVFNDGKVVGEHVGLAGKGQLEEMLGI
jgi:thioredoxin 1